MRFVQILGKEKLKFIPESYAVLLIILHEY